jgi:hypothetical protein
MLIADFRRHELGEESAVLPRHRQDAVCSVKELGEDGIDLIGGQQGGAVAQAG